MKELRELTEEQARHICEISNEPFLSFLTNNHGKWNTLGIEVNIYTTSTAEGSRDDSNISIYKNGKIVLWRNDGNWGGSRIEEINTVPIIDYLRKEGYEFIYK